MPIPMTKPLRRARAALTGAAIATLWALWAPTPAAASCVSVALGSGEAACVAPGGETFRDCPDCPEMVVAPAGTFRIGSEAGEADERPRREVTFNRPFAVGKFEVTRAEWAACVADGACPEKRVVGRGVDDPRAPINGVSWGDANVYVSWLTLEAGAPYRLLSEAEWEYAALAGSEAAFAFGAELTPKQAHIARGQTGPESRPALVGGYPANAFGIHDMHGNVWEWVADCYRPTYEALAPDGSARFDLDCRIRVLRGGSWALGAEFARAARRNPFLPHQEAPVFGFRVARTLVGAR